MTGIVPGIPTAIGIVPETGITPRIGERLLVTPCSMISGDPGIDQNPRNAGCDRKNSGDPDGSVTQDYPGIVEMGSTLPQRLIKNGDDVRECVKLHSVSPEGREKEHD